MSADKRKHDYCPLARTIELPRGAPQSPMLFYVPTREQPAVGAQWARTRRRDVCAASPHCGFVAWLFLSSLSSRVGPFSAPVSSSSSATLLSFTENTHTHTHAHTATSDREGKSVKPARRGRPDLLDRRLYRVSWPVDKDPLGETCCMCVCSTNRNDAIEESCRVLLRQAQWPRADLTGES